MIKDENELVKRISERNGTKLPMINDARRNSKFKKKNTLTKNGEVDGGRIRIQLENGQKISFEDLHQQRKKSSFKVQLSNTQRQALTDKLLLRTMDRKLIRRKSNVNDDDYLPGVALYGYKRYSTPSTVLKEIIPSAMGENIITCQAWRMP